MIYPSLTTYIETFISLDRHLRTLSFRALKSDDSLPQYSCSGGVCWFTVADDHDQKWLMGVFLNNKSREKFSLKPDQKIISGELMVDSIDNKSHPLDIVLRQRDFDPSQFKSIVSRPDNDGYYLQGEGYEPFQDDQSRRWGFYNHDTDTRIAAQWCSVELFAEGRAVVESKGLYGLIDNQGNVIIEPNYDEVSWDGSRYAYIEKDGLWGVYSRNGEKISEEQWQWIGEFANGYALVQRDDKYGFIDSHGELVIQPQYDDAGSFNQYGAAQVKIGKEKFFIDPKQRRV